MKGTKIIDKNANIIANNISVNKSTNNGANIIHTRIIAHNIADSSGETINYDHLLTDNVIVYQPILGTIILTLRDDIPLAQVLTIVRHYDDSGYDLYIYASLSKRIGPKTNFSINSDEYGTCRLISLGDGNWTMLSQFVTDDIDSFNV